MENLFQRSIEAISDNLAASGAHIASPDFPNYDSCWFVVGSFTAYDKDLVGEHTSAVRFLLSLSLAPFLPLFEGKNGSFRTLARMCCKQETRLPH